MSIYSRALRHIDLKDVKKKHHEKLVEQKIQKEIHNQIIEELKYKNSPSYSNWRFDLSEGMTSSGTFFTTLPATGDVDLQVTTLDANGYEVNSDVSFSSGTNSGFTGGFSGENGIINLNGEGEYSTEVASNYLDLSTVNSINITAIAGNNSNGGMLPTRSLQISFFTDTDISDPIDVISPSTSSFTNVNISIPQQFRAKDVGFILYSNTSDGFGSHGRHFRSQTIPISGLNHTSISGLFPVSADGGASISNQISFYLRDNKNTQQDFYNLGYFLWFNSMSQRFGWFDNVGTQEDPELVYRTWPAAPVSGATTFDNITAADYRYIGQTVYNLFKGTKLYGVSNVSFRRTTPMNVFVSLDSPEASVFVRTDPIMSNLSPEERSEILKNMLEASDEYLEKILGPDFPGTGAVPPGELGDTPGVEIAGGYGLRPDGTSGMNKVGDKVYDPATKKEYELVPSTKYGGGTQWTPVRQASFGQDYQVAHYEPRGQVISEKKLKSPQEILNKIPGYYDGKPAPLGFPEIPPPEMVNGMHPDLVDGKKVANRFNRLDPESAKATPLTGNPHIDKKIKAARKKVK